MKNAPLPPDIAAFLTDLAASDRSPATLATYRADLTRFARWFEDTNGERFTASGLTTTDIKEHRAHLLTSRHAPATVNRRLAALRSFCRWARTRNLAPDLPTDGVRDVTLPRLAPKALPKRQIDRVLKAAERRGKKRDIALLYVLRHAGLRVGELVALDLQDVTLGERKGSVYVVGKGQAARRVPLNAEARRTLAQYLAVRENPPPTAPVFPSQKGGRLTTHAVEELVRNYARQAGLENVTPHIFRHSFGKHLVEAGEPLPTVAAALGHANLNTTARYTQPSAHDLERAVARLAWED